MIGTAPPRNMFHRLGDAWQAFKAQPPSPSQMYPPNPNVQTGYMVFPGWNVLEQQQGGGRDEVNIRKSLQSISVYSNMQATANEFASAQLVVKQRKGLKLVDIDNHPLELLWESPNPHMGRSFLMSFWAWSYVLSGKAFLYWLPAGGQIQEVWPIPPMMIKPVPSTDTFIGGYAFRASPQAEPIFIPPELITYSHSINLFDLRDGLSFLAAALIDITSEIAESEWNQNFFKDDNGIPDGMLAVHKDTSDPDLFRIREEVRAFFGGTKRGVATVRAGDLAYTPFGRSQKDVEFSNGMLLASKRIDRAMGFPEGYWSERANRANAEQARETMLAGAVWPLAVRLSEDMNAQGGVVRHWYGDDLRAEFADIRPDDRELKLRELQFFAQVETVDELRDRIGDKKIGDVRGAMLIAEITKGQPIPASEGAQEQEDYLAEQEAENPPPEEAPPPEAAAPEGELPAEGETPPAEGEAAPPEEAPMPGEIPAKSLDLERWERKALKSLKRFHTAAVRFETNAIPLPEQARIVEALRGAQTAEDVRAAFKAEEDAHGTEDLISSEWSAALAWAKKAQRG